LAFGLATAASAAVVHAPIGDGASSIVKVADRCGRGWWRDPAGHCHPMAKGRWCPKGYHIGMGDGRCWPNM